MSTDYNFTSNQYYHILQMDFQCDETGKTDYLKLANCDKHAYVPICIVEKLDEETKKNIKIVYEKFFKTHINDNSLINFYYSTGTDYCEYALDCAIKAETGSVTKWDTFLLYKNGVFQKCYDFSDCKYDDDSFMVNC
jgi:hypothetical protein